MVARASMRRPDASAMVRREASGFTGSDRRASIRLASATSAVLICSKSSVRRRSSRLIVEVASTSICVSSCAPSVAGGIGRFAPSSKASAARFSAASALRSSCAPRIAGSISAIMCSR